MSRLHLAAPFFWGPRLLFVIFLLGALFFLKGRITGDGFSYYAWLRSPVMDGDFDFTNEYTDHNPNGYWTTIDETTATGLKANPFAIGPAILWLPWFALAWGLTAWLGPLLGAANDGYSFFYQTLIPLGSYVYVFIGSVLLYRLVRRYADAEIVSMTLVAVLLASPLLNYLFNEPAASHPLSFFVISLFYWYWLSTNKLRADADNFLGGMLGGLVFLVRWQQVIFLLPVIIDKIARRRWFQAFLFTFGFGITAIWQLFAWKIVYGDWLVIPQTSGFFIPPTEVLTWLGRIPLLWFSPNHGLFYWHPMLLIGIYGMVRLWTKDRALSAVLLVIFILSSVINSLVWEYYGGWAFGARRMIETLPLLAIGMAVAFSEHRFVRWRVPLVIAAVVWNGLLYCQYVIKAIDPTGPLQFPGWIWGQVTHFPEGAAKAFGQSVVLSNLYYGANGQPGSYWLAGSAAVLIILCLFGASWMMRRLRAA